MRVLLQRVLHAQVDIISPEKTYAPTSVPERYTSGAIGKGLLLFVGFSKEDSEAKLIPMRDKLLGLRIFPNEEGKFDRSVSDIEDGQILIVSQFTLYGDCRKGRRPDFFQSLEPQKAEALYDEFVRVFKNTDIRTETGVFGAQMEVSLANDGPVTLMLES